ncbi:MAG: hypothetical protein ACXW1F_04115, partial [Halobacteriota archaeon]
RSSHNTLARLGKFKNGKLEAYLCPHSLALLQKRSAAKQGKKELPACDCSSPTSKLKARNDVGGLIKALDDPALELRMKAICALGNLGVR